MRVLSQHCQNRLGGKQEVEQPERPCVAPPAATQPDGRSGAPLLRDRGGSAAVVRMAGGAVPACGAKGRRCSRYDGPRHACCERAALSERAALGPGYAQQAGKRPPKAPSGGERVNARQPPSSIAAFGRRHWATYACRRCDSPSWCVLKRVARSEAATVRAGGASARNAFFAVLVTLFFGLASLARLTIPYLGYAQRATKSSGKNRAD